MGACAEGTAGGGRSSLQSRDSVLYRVVDVVGDRGIDGIFYRFREGRY
jgi:hypothetical protein